VLIVGAISLSDTGYCIELKTIGAPDSDTARYSEEVKRKEDVLAAIASLASRVLAGLGETSSDMSETEAAETVSAASLEAMRAYARAQELTMAHRIQEALTEYERAVSLDAGFGRAYAGMGVIYSNYFKEIEKAEASYKAALKHLDRMTERERYRTLGTYYLNVARNYPKAIENYEILARLYPADDGAHGNLALASVLMGDIARAQAEVRKSLELYPRNSLQRYNYAMYSMYAADFETAITEAVRLHDENPRFEYAFLPMALSQLASDQVIASATSYDRMAALSSFGASFATLGRADTHMYFGRWRDAVAALAAGIERDATANDTRDMAQKYVALAEARLALHELEEAVAAARRAIELNRHESTLFPAARVLLHAGRHDAAAGIAADLKKMLQRHTTAYARMIKGEIAAISGLTAEAIDEFQEVQMRCDSWFSRFLLGRIYADSGHHAEALAELDVCVKRCGEVTDAYFYDMPTLRYLPPLFYWVARAQEGIGLTSQARASYLRFLHLRSNGEHDDFVGDAQKRVRALSR
jgi:tetratricopeptide (TPR) repeat protein